MATPTHAAAGGSGGIHVRSPEVSDAAAIARAHIRAWQVGYRELMPSGFLDSLDEETGARRWAERLAAAERGEGETGVEFLVAETMAAYDRAPELVGVATIGPERPSTATTATTIVGEVWMINVRPDVWRSGFGSTLLQAATDRLRERGSGELVLWVLRDNDRARRFYEANGWIADGATKTEMTGGALLPEVRYRHRGGRAGSDQA